MKTKVIVTLCVVFVLGFVCNSYAQLIANSPEDKAFTKVLAEENADAKLALLLDYEKSFPQSKQLPDIYLMLMEVYRQKNDTAKVVETGEKIIKIDAENVTALMAVSRNLALERKQLDKAVLYAQKAVDAVEKMKTQSPPGSYTDAQWKEYVETTDQAARSILSYAKSVKP